MSSGRWLLGLLALIPFAASAEDDACDAFGALVEATPVAEGDTLIGGRTRNHHVGYSIAHAGDVNGDGYPDLAVGAPGARHNGGRSGAVYLFYGPIEDIGQLSISSADVTFVGPGPGAQLGASVAGVGDVDGDGRDDLMIGALPQADSFAATVAPQGVAWLILGDQFSPFVDTMASSEATFRGTTPGDEFGTAIGGAGDLNGDGFADIVIGAPKSSLGAHAGGAAYVFYGPAYGLREALSADRVIVGVTEQGRLGLSVAGIGDTDGDGLDDLVIGAPQDPVNGQKSGSAYVFYGSYESASGQFVEANMAGTILRGRQYDRLGASVAAAGDVDGDGLADFWVGAKQYGATKRGAAYLMYGQAEPMGDVTAENVFTSRMRGTDANDLFGSAIVGDIDVNGDGVVDALIGGERGDGGELQSGAAWVVYGPFETDGRVTEVGKLYGDTQLDFTGHAVAAADFNGDGFDDPVVGAWRADAIAPKGGRVGIFMGGTDVADVAPWYLDGDGDGWGVDSSEQLACAAPGDDWVYRGGDCDDQSRQYHPYAVELDCADLNDYNCDGSVGQDDADGDGVMACRGDCDDTRADVYLGAEELCFDDIDNDCDGGVDDDGSVDALDWYPDVDGDSYGAAYFGFRACSVPDFMLSHPTVNVGGDCDDYEAANHPGAPEYCDGEDNDCDGVTDESDAIDAKPFFPDADADGRGDLYGMQTACAQPEGFVSDSRDCDDSDASIHPGAVEVCDFVDNDCDGTWYRGGPQFIEDMELELTGALPAEHFGQELMFADDMNGDGIPEIVVAAPWSNLGADKSGAVYLRYGDRAGGKFDMGEMRVDGSSRWDVRLMADRPEAFFGGSMATGDFNGDGIGDLAVGSEGMRGPDQYQGAVFLFFGPLEGEYTHREADVLIGGLSGFDYFGTAIDSGDLDGDGYDDLVMAAYREDGPGFRRGAVHIMYGKPDLVSGYADVVGDAAMFGSEDRGELGHSVAIIGDVNGDGYVDLAAGSNYFGALDTGNVSVLYGGPDRHTGALQPDVEFITQVTDEEFGVDLIGLGDVNGDGIDDLLMGTANNRAWMVYGDAGGLLGGDIAVTADVKFTGAADGEGFGEHLAAPGDMNGDGLADLVFSADRDNNGGLNAGAVYVLYGNTSFPDVVSMEMVESFGRLPEGRDFPTLSVANLEGRFEGGKLMGTVEEAHFGSAIAAGADINGDRFPDLLVGSFFMDEYRGHAGLLYSSPYGVDWAPAEGVEWYTSLEVDGAPDEWLETFSFATSTGGDTRAAVTWDWQNFYFGYTSVDVATGGPNHAMVVYLGNGDGYGATTTPPLGGQVSTLSFEADAALVWRVGATDAEMFVASGSSWSFGGTVRAIGGQVASDATRQTVELSVPRVALGALDAIEVAAWWTFDGGTQPVSFGAVPAGGFDDGSSSPQLARHLDIGRSSPLAPASWPLQPGGGDAPVVEDDWDWWVYDRDQDGQGDDTPTFFWSCPMHAPIWFPDPVGLRGMDQAAIRGVQDMELATDCDDYDPTVYFGAREIVGDGVDNDCVENVNAVPVVTVDLAEVGTNGLAYATVTVTDADEGTAQETEVYVYYTWYVNGVEVAGQHGPALDGAVYFDKGDTVEVMIVADDGLDVSDPVWGEFVVPNTRPVATSAEIGPVDATVADDIIADCQGTDADGDEVTFYYNWHGQPAADDADGSDTIPADTLDPNILIVVECTPQDGDDSGDSIFSDGLRPGAAPVPGDTDYDSDPPDDQAPIVDGCAITPSHPEDEDDLTATISAFDPDGDPVSVSVSWAVGGELRQLRFLPLPTGTTIDLLSADETFAGELMTLTCVAVAGGLTSEPARDTTNIYPLPLVDTGDTGTGGPTDTDATDVPVDTVDTDLPAPVCVDAIDLKYTLYTEYWAYEIDWEVTDPYGTVYASSAGATYGNYRTYSSDLLLPPGNYTVDMYDSYGDGWNGGYFRLIDPVDGATVAQSGLNDGAFAQYAFRVDCDGTVIPGGVVVPQPGVFTICGTVRELDPLGNEVPTSAASVTVAFDTWDNGIGGSLSATDGLYCITDIVIPDSWNPSSQPYLVAATKFGFETATARSGVDFAPVAGSIVNLDFLLTPQAQEVCFFEDFEGVDNWTEDNPVSHLGVGWAWYEHDWLNPLYDDAIPHCVEMPENEDCAFGELGCAICATPFSERCLPDSGALPTPWSGRRYAWFGNVNQGDPDQAGANFMGVGGSCEPAGSDWPAGGNGGWSTIRDMEGELTSPRMRVPTTGDPTLQLSAWFEIESVDPQKPPTGYDHLVVSVIREDGQVDVIGSMNSQIDLDGRPGQNYSSGGFGRAPVWNIYRYDLGGYVGQNIRLRFRFWSKDEKYNGFRGWGLDDIFLFTTGGQGCAN